MGVGLQAKEMVQVKVVAAEKYRTFPPVQIVANEAGKE